MDRKVAGFKGFLYALCVAWAVFSGLAISQGVKLWNSSQWAIALMGGGIFLAFLAIIFFMWARKSNPFTEYPF